LRNLLGLRWIAQHPADQAVDLPAHPVEQRREGRLIASGHTQQQRLGGDRSYRTGLSGDNPQRPGLRGCHRLIAPLRIVVAVVVIHGTIMTVSRAVRHALRQRLVPVAGQRRLTFM
jgi:hypothetical protein